MHVARGDAAGGGVGAVGTGAVGAGAAGSDAVASAVRRVRALEELRAAKRGCVRPAAVDINKRLMVINQIAASRAQVDACAQRVCLVLEMAARGDAATRAYAMVAAAERCVARAVRACVRACEDGRNDSAPRRGPQGTDVDAGDMTASNAAMYATAWVVALCMRALPGFDDVVMGVFNEQCHVTVPHAGRVGSEDASVTSELLLTQQIMLYAAVLGVPETPQGMERAWRWLAHVSNSPPNRVRWALGERGLGGGCR